MNTLQIQDTFQPYYAGRKTAGPIANTDNRKTPRYEADNTQAPTPKKTPEDAKPES